jgi:hypothetical protein
LAIGYNLAVSIFGGTTPLVLTALESATGSNLVAPMYMMIAAVIAEVLHTGAGIGRQWDLVTGETPLDEAVASA